jgi:hypothetical protein
MNTDSRRSRTKDSRRVRLGTANQSEGCGLLGELFAPRADLDRDEVISLLQDVLDSGVIFELQGSYLREAERLISAGKVANPRS